MEKSNRDIIEGLMQAFMNRNLEESLSFFAEDALLYDPHYPIPEMKGKGAIQQGLEWGLGNIEKPGFTVRHIWENDNTGAVELDTHHVFKGGMEVKFDQVFVYETRDGLITRLQAYVPYSPGGIGGILATLTRWAWKLKGKV